MAALLATRLPGRRASRFARAGARRRAGAGATLAQTTRLRVGTGPVVARFVHFTDLHHKGDRPFLARVIRRINSLRPDFVCFTGDIVEEARYLDEALAGIRTIKAPVYGVPGNHDYWAGADFAKVERAFADTGGAWLPDRAAVAPGGKVTLLGSSCTRRFALAPVPGRRNVALIHYPSVVESLPPRRFDLVLAGHSHGGQVRLPFVGALVKPFAVDAYELGRYETAAGPLYVGAGIGWFYLNVRFLCRPEVTVVEV